MQEPSDQTHCTFVNCARSDEKTLSSSFGKTSVDSRSAGRISKSRLENGIYAAESRAVLATKSIVLQKEDEMEKEAASTCGVRIDQITIEEKAELIASRFMHGTDYLYVRRLAQPPQFVELFIGLNNTFSFANEIIIHSIMTMSRRPSM